MSFFLFFLVLFCYFVVFLFCYVMCMLLFVFFLTSFVFAWGDDFYIYSCFAAFVSWNVASSGDNNSFPPWLWCCRDVVCMCRWLCISEDERLKCFALRCAKVWSFNHRSFLRGFESVSAPSIWIHVFNRRVYVFLGCIRSSVWLDFDSC